METFKIQITAAFMVFISVLMAQDIVAFRDNRNKLQIGVKAGANNSDDISGQGLIGSPVWGTYRYLNIVFFSVIY